MQTIAWTTFFALQINVDEVLSKYLSRLEIDAPRAPTWSQDTLSRIRKFVKDHVGGALERNGDHIILQTCMKPDVCKDSLRCMYSLLDSSVCWSGPFHQTTSVTTKRTSRTQNPATSLPRTTHDSHSNTSWQQPKEAALKRNDEDENY